MAILVKLWDAVVFVILFQLTPPFSEYSHLTMEPVCPDKVTVPLVPLHTVVFAGFKFPPTLNGLTVTMALDEKRALHAPFAT